MSRHASRHWQNTGILMTSYWAHYLCTECSARPDHIPARSHQIVSAAYREKRARSVGSRRCNWRKASPCLLSEGWMTAAWFREWQFKDYGSGNQMLESEVQTERREHQIRQRLDSRANITYLCLSSSLPSFPHWKHWSYFIPKRKIKFCPFFLWRFFFFCIVQLFSWQLNTFTNNFSFFFVIKCSKQMTALFNY